MHIYTEWKCRTVYVFQKQDRWEIARALFPPSFSPKMFFLSRRCGTQKFLSFFSFFLNSVTETLNAFRNDQLYQLSVDFYLFLLFFYPSIAFAPLTDPPDKTRSQD